MKLGNICRLCGGTGKMRGLGLMEIECACKTIPQGFVHTIKNAEISRVCDETPEFVEVSKDKPAKLITGKRMGRPPKVKS